MDSLFSGDGGLLEGGGGLEGEPKGAVKFHGGWVALLQCMLSIFAAHLCPHETEQK